LPKNGNILKIFARKDLYMRMKLLLLGKKTNKNDEKNQKSVM